MVNIYVNLIRAGRRTLNDISNTKMREKVRKALIASGCIINQDGSVTIQ